MKNYITAVQSKDPNINPKFKQIRAFYSDSRAYLVNKECTDVLVFERDGENNEFFSVPISDEDSVIEWLLDQENDLDGLRWSFAPTFDEAVDLTIHLKF